jgi:hypothetical protein
MGKVSKTIFFDTAVSLGYCCARKLLETNDKVRTSVLASKLGFDVRTIQLWRKAFRASELRRCERCRHVGQGKPLQETSKA